MSGPMIVDLAPGTSLDIVEITANHWIATCRDLVLAIGYEGSHADLGHVHAASRAFERVTRRHGRARFLFALPPVHSKAPTSEVREAISRAAKRYANQTTAVAFVVSGTGFAAAVHRGAATGLLALLRPPYPVRVASTLREGLAFLGSDDAGSEELARYCESLVHVDRGPRER